MGRTDPNWSSQYIFWGEHAKMQHWSAENWDTGSMSQVAWGPSSPHLEGWMWECICRGAYFVQQPKPKPVTPHPSLAPQIDHPTPGPPDWPKPGPCHPPSLLFIAWFMLWIKGTKHDSFHSKTAPCCNLVVKGWEGKIVMRFLLTSLTCNSKLTDFEC